MPIKIYVYTEDDKKIGMYRSCIVPRVGEILDANNGNWVVKKVQHDLRGSLHEFDDTIIQSCVIVYVESNK